MYFSKLYSRLKTPNRKTGHWQKVYSRTPADIFIRERLPVIWQCSGLNATVCGDTHTKWTRKKAELNSRQRNAHSLSLFRLYALACAGECGDSNHLNAVMSRGRCSEFRQNPNERALRQWERRCVSICLKFSDSDFFFGFCWFHQTLCILFLWPGVVLHHSTQVFKISFWQLSVQKKGPFRKLEIWCLWESCSEFNGDYTCENW